MSGKDTEQPMESECHNSQIKVETTIVRAEEEKQKDELVLLDTTQVDIKVKDLREALETSKFVYVPAFDLTIEKIAELPELKWIVSLLPVKDNQDDSFYLEVHCYLIEGYEKLLGTKAIFYDFKAEVLDDQGMSWKSFDYETTDLSSDLSKNERDLSLYVTRNESTRSIWQPLGELPLQSDGSLVFRITLEFSVFRMISPFPRQVDQVKLNGKEKEMTLETRRSKIKFETQANDKNLVLISRKEVEWRVVNLRQILESPEPLSAFSVPQFDFLVERTAELPKLKWRVSLVQDEDTYITSSGSERYSLEVRWQLLEGYGSLLGNKIIHTLKMEVLNEEGNVWTTTEFRYSDLKVDMDKCKREFELYLNGRGDGRKHVEELPLASDGSLTFRFTLQYFANRMTIPFEKEVYPKTVDCWLRHFERRAQADEVIVAGTEPDVQIISSDGKTVHFHKELLMARSPVFEAMFRSEMKESQSSVVKLDDVSEEAINLIHHFIYDGKLLPYVEKWRCSEDLGEIELCIYVVTKYQLEDFIKFFDKLLGSLCNEANAMDLLKLCNRFSLMGAREDVREFIHGHPEVLNNIV